MHVAYHWFIYPFSPFPVSCEVNLCSMWLFFFQDQFASKNSSKGKVRRIIYNCFKQKMTHHVLRPTGITLCTCCMCCLLHFTTYFVLLTKGPQTNEHSFSCSYHCSLLVLSSICRDISFFNALGTYANQW